LAPVSGSSNQPAAVRAFANLSLAADGSVLGSIHMLIEQATEPVLKVRWPRGALLRAALLDGRPIQPVTEGPEGLAFALGSDRKVHRLALHWLHSGERGLSSAARISEEFPVPVDLEMKALLLEAAVPSQFRALAPAGFETLGPGIFAGEMKTIVTSGEQVSNDESAVPEQMPVVSESRTILRGRLDSDHNLGAIRLWVYRDALVTIPLAVAAFVLFVAALFWISNSAATSWLAKGQPLLLAVVGGAWWVFISPRIVGIALLIAAMIWFAKKQRTLEPRRRDRLPSTVHLPG
jgi:hypothetical protein